MLLILVIILCCAAAFAAEGETEMASVLPEGTRRIEDSAFANSGIKKLLLPWSVEYIAKNAFEGCEGMTALVYEGSYALNYCKENKIPYEVLSGKIKVGIIHLNPAESGYRERNVQDLQDTFMEENGYDATFVQTTGGDQQKMAFRSLMNEGVQYILLCPFESVGWDELLLEAKEAGIGVFLFDRMIQTNPDYYIAAVVSSMTREAETVVDWLGSLELSEYRILHIKGMIGSAAQIGRSTPLEEKAQKDSKWSIVYEGTGAWYQDEAYKITEVALRSGEIFNIVYAENDSMALGAEDALDAYGITHGDGGDVMIIGFDCDKWAMRKVLNGYCNYNMQCSPFQADPMDRMIKTLEIDGTISGLDELHQYFTPEIGFSKDNISEEAIARYGLGD